MNDQMINATLLEHWFNDSRHTQKLMLLLRSIDNDFIYMANVFRQSSTNFVLLDISTNLNLRCCCCCCSVLFQVPNRVSSMLIVWFEFQNNEVLNL